ncbi:MAG: hypothetical protein LBG65_07810 [Puniceicoccales bacterium]|jgi:hypothetical protein|nr:hypothetical protein [Puniceicoccales bacterium]
MNAFSIVAVLALAAPTCALAKTQCACRNRLGEKLMRLQIEKTRLEIEILNGGNGSAVHHGWRKRPAFEKAADHVSERQQDNNPPDEVTPSILDQLDVKPENQPCEHGR